MGFSYLDFLSLKFKKFWRSKNFSKKLFFKLLLLIGYTFFVLEIVLLGLLAYFLIKEQFPDSDYFVKLNEYIYIFLVLSFSFIMAANAFSPEEVKPLMILPVSKKRIILYSLINNLLSPVFLILSLWVLLVGAVYIYHGYSAFHILLWMIALWITLLIFNLMAWLNERSAWMGLLFSLSLIGVLASIKIAPQWFKPVGRFYYGIYQANWIYFLLLVLGGAGAVYAIYRYMRKNFYLDGKLKSKSKGKMQGAGLYFADNFGKTGAFIQNDIRLILRNTRAKMILQSSLFFLIFAAFIYYAPIYKDNEFMYVFTAISISAIFLLNFGSFVPAWDSEYFKLLMSQSISYRDYLEAKWWLMAVSVGIMTLLSLPFLYFGWDIYKMILAFAVFNAGMNIYIVLLTGLLNTTRMKLNEKVSAFSGGQGFNGRMMLLSFIRFAVPLLLYFGLRKFFDYDTTLLIIAGLGILGFLLKNYFMKALTRLYIKRKYIMIEAFSEQE